MQPYFLPYLSYFQLINATNKFIVYDDVTYIKGGWINRNKLLENAQGKFFNVELKSLSSNKLIKDIKLNDNSIWRTKLCKRIKQNYHKAPFFTEIMPIIEDIIFHEANSISSFNVYSIKRVIELLKLQSEVKISSEQYQNQHLKSEDRVIDICLLENASVYINAINGKGLYSQKSFEENGISLNFLKSGEINYFQYSNRFVPNLSILDVLMFNSFDSISGYLQNYALEK